MARDDIRLNITADSSSVTRAAATASLSIKGMARSVERENTRMVRSNRETHRSLADMDGAMGKVNQTFSFLRNVMRTLKWPALAAGIGLATQALNALAAGAVATTGALSTLSGTLVAYPALVAAAVQAFGAAKLASTGIGDAVKASLDGQAAATKDASAELDQHRQSVEQVRSAKQQLTSAQHDATRAQRDLTAARGDARRELREMRFEVEQAGLSERGAVIAVKRARQQLRRTLNDPDAGRLDLMEAELGVDDALLGLRRVRDEARRTRQDVRQAKGGGVDRMPGVVAAKQSLAQANLRAADASHQLAEAQRDARGQLGQTSGAVDKQAEAMGKLAPAAQRFVRTLLELKPRLDELRAATAAGLFPGAERGLRSAMRNFGVFKSVMADTAGALGDLAAKSGKMLGSQAWGRDLDTVGKRNVQTIERLGSAGLHLADAFRHVLVAAGPFIGFLTRWADKGAAALELSAKTNRANGDMARFFTRTRQTLEVVVPMLRDFGMALVNIASAGRGVGMGLLGDLADTAKELRAWTESAKGRNELDDYFRQARPTIEEIASLLRDIGGMFLRLGANKGTSKLIRQLRTELLPVIEELIGSATEAFGPRLVDLVVSLAKTFTKLMGPTGALTVLADLLTLASDGLRALLEAPGLGAFTASMITLAGVWKGINFGTMGGAAKALGKLAGRGGLLGSIGGRFAERGSSPANPVFVEDVTGGGGGGGGGGGKNKGPLSKVDDIAKGAAGGGAGAAAVKFGKKLLPLIGKGGVVVGLATQTAANASLINQGRENARRREEAGLPPGVEPGDAWRRGHNLPPRGPVHRSAGERLLDTGFVQQERTNRTVEANLRRNVFGGQGFRAPWDDPRTLRTLDTLSGAVQRRTREVTRDIKKMSEESGGSIKGLAARAAENFKRIRDSIGLHTREGRQLAQRNFREAAEGIARSMRDGRGSTRDGMAAIERLIKTHSRGGKEGLKRNLVEAQDAIRRTMRRGGELTDQGLRLIRRLMVAELKLYGVSPKDALHAVKQGGTRDDTFRVAGHARGGLVQYGQPGEKGRDSILTRIGGQPLMVAPGELGAVLTADQQAELNARTADVGGLRGFMRKFNRPHHMARGGWVGASPAGLNPAIKSIGQWAMNKYDAAASSTLRGGDPGFHGRGAAVDLTSGNMLAMARGIDAAFRPRLLELIHTPLGYSVDNGRRTAPFAQADHYDHVHAAAMGRALAAALRKIGRVTVEGRDSPLRDIVQRTLDMARAGANRQLDAAALAGGVDIPHFEGDWVEVLEQIAAAKGWSVADWKELVDRESGGNPRAVNPSSGAFGLGQFLGSTATAYAPHGALSRNPVEQIHAMAKYIADRYDTPSAALEHHSAKNWYGRGGLVGRVAGAARGLLSADTGVITRGKPGKQPKDKIKYTPKHKKKAKRRREIAGVAEERQFNDLTTMAEDLEASAVNAENLFQINADQLLQTDKDGKPVLDEDGKPVLLDELSQGERADLVGRWQQIRGVHAGQRRPLAERLRDIAAGHVARLNQEIQERAKEWRENMKYVERMRRQIEELQDKIRRAREENEQDRDTIERIRNRPGPLTDAERGRIRGLRDRIEGRRENIAWWDHHIETRQIVIRRRHEGNVDLYGKREPDPERDGGPTAESQIGRRIEQRDQTWAVLQGDMVQELRPSGIDAQVVGADQQIAALQRGENTGPLVDGTSQRDAERAGLLEQLLGETRRSLAISQAQFAVFRDFAPLVGRHFSRGGLMRFAQGGVVPETGLALVHRHETIIPDPQGAFGSQLAGRTVARDAPEVTVLVKGGIGELVDEIEVLVDGKIARHKQRVEQRSRTFARGPGRS